MDKINFLIIGLFVLCANTTIVAQQYDNSNRSSDILIGKTYTTQSDILNEDREFRILLPESYENSTSKYPVIYVLDGDSYYLAAYSAVKALSSQSIMPEAIVIAVTSPRREIDMTPPFMNLQGVDAPGGDKFLKYLCDELIPSIDKTYRTLPLRVLLGHSHGALFNMYALIEKPKAFNWHLAIDAPIHLENYKMQRKVEEFLLANPHQKGRLNTVWNRFELDSSWINLENDVVDFNIMTFKLFDETHSSMYYPAFYKGLKLLFSDYTYVHEKIVTLQELDRLYKSMSFEYGYEIKIPQKALANGSTEHLVAADYIQAKPFVERLLKDYGTSMSMRDDLHIWLKSLENNPPEESRVTYLQKPDAKPEQLSSYVGNWSDGENTIEIYLKERKIQGYFKQIMPSGKELSTKIEKFIILEDGSLEIAYSNKKFPFSAIFIYRLTQNDSKNMVAQSRFIAYWPRMRSMMNSKWFNLKKIE